ncbi:YhzD family protein [Bacillus massiliglaciei]|uniref:YhzD family protein n=1 Tax=Bacillus massiliglaciei TaxID=1816693 RepID=UPI000DA60AB7|nr:YhzD family protein [Bacillus massiliglaciei]
MSKLYKLTVFDPSGEKLLDESINAENNNDAKEIAERILEEKGYEERTHRCTAPDGKMIVFHR